MAYIVLVNPSILGQAGMPVAAVAAATCFAAGFASILMGLVANTPLALAPGMGLNAYFSFTVVQGMGVPWPIALGCVFISGVAFLILTLTGVRQLIVAVIPTYLFAAVAGGIGLFIGFIGLKNAGIVVGSPATLVALGDLKSPGAALALFGLVVIGALSVWNVRGAMLIGIVATTIAGAFFGLVTVSPEPYSLEALTGTAFKLDLAGVFGLTGSHGLGLLEILFVFLFVDLFDNIGTLVAVTKRAGLMDKAGKIPGLNRILMTDAVATMVGSMAGTSTVTSYVESAAGVQAGGRTGLTAVVTGVLFLLTMFVAPLCAARAACRDRACAHRGGRAHAAAADRGRLGRPDEGDPRFPHRRDDPADVLHRQRPRLRHHRARRAQAGARQGHDSRLVPVPARGAVRGSLRLDERGMIRAACLALLVFASPVAAQKLDATPRTVVMTAFAPEYAALVPAVEKPQEYRINGLTFVAGTMAGRPVLLMQSGVSMVNAAMNTQLVLDRFAVKRIVFSGIAGRHRPGLCRSATWWCRRAGRNIWKSASRARPTRAG